MTGPARIRELAAILRVGLPVTIGEASTSHPNIAISQHPWQDVQHAGMEYALTRSGVDPMHGLIRLTAGLPGTIRVDVADTWPNAT